MNVVFFDIDNTIIDNRSIRNKAAALAMECLELQKTAGEFLPLYEKVVEYGHFFELAGLTNFIHIWNSHDLYAVMKILHTQNEANYKQLSFCKNDQAVYIKKIDELQTAFSGLRLDQPSFDREMYQRFKNKVTEDPDIQKFMVMVKKVKRQPDIKKAYRVFQSSLRFVPVSGFTDLLHKLTKHGFHVYFVSEGIEKIQGQKLKQLGLSRFYRQRLLTTGAAVNNKTGEHIRKMIDRYEKRLRDTNSSDSKKFAYIQRIKTLSYAEKLFASYGDKSNPFFYARVIHAVKQDHKRPLNRFTQFAYIPVTRWHAGPPLRIAMIGDRYEKDIHPLLELSGKNVIISILLNRGKYKKAFPREFSFPGNKDIQPDFIAEDFKAVEDILFDPAVWHSRKPVPYSDIIPVDTQENIQFLKNSFTKKFPHIKKIINILVKQREANQIGHSLYQKESQDFYLELRKIHSAVFTFDEKRVYAEKHEKRYFNGNYRGINNLYTFVNIMVSLLKDKEKVRGIDYGCGSHYLVHDLSTRYGWDISGFDSDKYAIQIAKENYTESAARYIFLDLLSAMLPVNDASQDFVFCNAVIQHFDNIELDFSLQDISRVLKPGGLFMLIFKRNIKDWESFKKKYNMNVIILDYREGKIEIEDRKIKQIINELPGQKRTEISPKYLSGLRLFHFFSIAYILKAANVYQLKVKNTITIPGDDHDVKGIITYQSGKGIPNSMIIFQKKK
ncbi:MAG: class I SAM-dependent methyltransferase [Spirochaetales bacterium]|nr:class I SAM-dependent methyltransferase [Spirochaetales bacterium]